jgi:hypothetical protein
MRFRSAIFAVGFLCFGAQHASAQSLAFQEYEGRISFFQRNFAIAWVASLCQIRSGAYLTLFNEARQKVFEGERAKQRLLPQEWKQIDNDLNDLTSKIFVQIKFKTDGRDTLGSACLYLPNSSELADADDAARLLRDNFSAIR